MALENDSQGNLRVTAGPARKLAAVTPNDATDLPGGTCRALWIGTGGNVALIAADDSSAVTLTNVPAGPLPVAAKRVMNTSTTASGIVALY